MIAIPSGRRSSEPTPWPSASGTAPSMAAIVVIRMGRKRSRQAWWMASRGFLCSCRSAASAKSIIMMAFFCTMPIRRTMPMIATMVSSLPQMIRARRAPTPAEGRVERIVIGWM